MTTNNPLLDLSDLPRYADISPAHVDEAIIQSIAQARAAVEAAESMSKDAVSWSTFIEPLEAATEQLSRVWGVVSHCHHVIDTPEWREAYNAHLEDVTVFWTTLGQSEALLNHYKTLADEPHFSSLSPTRQHIITSALRDFKLSGALLNDADKAEFLKLSTELSSLQAKFSENLLDATNAFAHYATLDDLRGLPDEAIDAMRAAAQADNQDGYKITLQFPSYFPVMQYADHRALRELVYQAYVTRASDANATQPEFDNTENMQKILAIRQRVANLLGFAHHSDVSLATKMADSVTQVAEFLNHLAAQARPSALIDFEELKQFAKDILGIEELQAWDAIYVSEKLRQARYAFSEQEVKDHFPLSKTLDGLFHVIKGLFGVELVRTEAQVWHPDVQFFQLKKANQVIGGVYLDPYARAGKNQGAWMDEVRSRSLKIDGGVQTPVALMVCNFSPPLEGSESTLTHDDLITLFHESGHALHHLLTQVNDIAVAGIRGVEWDAVELPSQFMENFCWDYDILTRMSAHIETGEPLPHSLFDKMLAAKNFQSGLQMLRQVEFSLYDILLHEQYRAETPDAIYSILADVRSRVSVIPTPSYNRFQHSFGHIFSGGYSAGYYSYKWAEVLSADVFSAFESAQAGSAPLLNTELGQKYWQNILAVGGSRPAMESFKAFMGREPSVDALLRHSGLVTA
jgi:oligopeptidase A